MESTHELEEFKKRSVFVVCWAGSDRSKLIADELNSRGYIASHGGVMEGHNYVTTNDLYGIGTIIFSSANEKKKFDRIKKLRDFVSKNSIETRVLSITEADKDRAFNDGNRDVLQVRIRQDLDACGFVDKNPR